MQRPSRHREGMVMVGLRGRGLTRTASCNAPPTTSWTQQEIASASTPGAAIIDALRKVERGTEAPRPVDSPYGLKPRSSEYLLANLKCSSAGGGPIVTQNKAPRSMAETIVMPTSLKFIVQMPHCTLNKNPPPIAQRGALVSLPSRRSARRSNYRRSLLCTDFRHPSLSHNMRNLTERAQIFENSIESIGHPNRLISSYYPASPLARSAESCGLVRPQPSPRSVASPDDRDGSQGFSRGTTEYEVGAQLADIGEESRKALRI
jgi:hypothetical protein